MSDKLNVTVIETGSDKGEPRFVAMKAAPSRGDLLTIASATADAVVYRVVEVTWVAIEGDGHGTDVLLECTRLPNIDVPAVEWVN